METNNNTNNINSQNRTSETKGESVSPVGSEALDIKELKEAFMRNTKDLRETLATLVRNPYVVSVLIFLLWMTFIDDDNLITSHRYSQKIEELSEEKESLLNGIEQDRREMKELKSNSETLEKFAREKYFMKKDDEVIFIIK
ncbi:MAG: septum formation initiator family protein [Marinilabiliaceae bacterium]|nr:septum formation initiator family protein [Bacteroidales bacterium]MDD5816644.1 septum formation initiator family protein [Bacteroidales bacterium]MDY4521821.1 septum formation initiator family protein [Bacteroidales bacterium]